MGCDRCQQIFVVQDNQQVIEQLSSIYQKRAWRWNGHRWISIYPGLSPNTLSLLFITIVLSPIIFAIASIFYSEYDSLGSLMLDFNDPFGIVTLASL